MEISKIIVANEVRYSVTSDGTKSQDWAKRLDYFVDDCARKILDGGFSTTSGITYNIAVLVFDKRYPVQDVLDYAAARGLGRPHPEVACLTKEKFPLYDELKKMGIHRILVMHQDCFRLGKLRIAHYLSMGGVGGYLGGEGIQDRKDSSCISDGSYETRFDYGYAFLEKVDL